MASKHDGTQSNGSSQNDGKPASISGPMAERRASARHAVELDVGLGKEQNYFSGFAENLSLGGGFIASHAIKPVGEPLEVRLFLPDRTVPLRIAAEVRWARSFDEKNELPPGMGVAFRTLSRNDEQLLAAFLASLREG
ncbi:MAG: PilZ domain-containing protein [Polyangiaceae bacterium]|nr:PilZ domain-containing protein [Polyangiaceae bacterium]